MFCNNSPVHPLKSVSGTLVFICIYVIKFILLVYADSLEHWLIDLRLTGRDYALSSKQRDIALIPIMETAAQ